MSLKQTVIPYFIGGVGMVFGIVGCEKKCQKGFHWDNLSKTCVIDNDELEINPCDTLWRDEQGRHFNPEFKNCWGYTDPKDTIKPKPETTFKIYLHIIDNNPVEFVNLWNSIPDTGNYYLNLDSAGRAAIGMKNIDSVAVHIDWTKAKSEYSTIERRNQLEAICGITANNRFSNGAKINPNINRRIGIVPTAGGPDTLFICLIPDCNDWMSKNYTKDGDIDRIEKDTNICRELFFTAMDYFPVKDFYHNLYESKGVWYQRDAENSYRQNFHDQKVKNQLKYKKR